MIRNKSRTIAVKESSRWIEMRTDIIIVSARGVLVTTIDLWREEERIKWVRIFEWRKRMLVLVSRYGHGELDSEPHYQCQHRCAVELRPAKSDRGRGRDYLRNPLLILYVWLKLILFLFIVNSRTTPRQNILTITPISQKRK